MKQVTIRKFPTLDYACGEAVNTLCTNISFSREDVKKIMITSSRASEGKTFLAMNLMRSLTKLGKRVVLVDADMRASVLTSKYWLKFPSKNTDKGLAHLLAGMAEENEIIYATDIPDAYLIPIGRAVPDALSLLMSPRFAHLMRSLDQNFDYVIVDAPPVGAVIDAAQIAKSCDGIILVVKYNSIRRQELVSAKEQLEQSGCPILGTVINQVDYRDYVGRNYYFKSYYSNNYYKNGYGYGYGSQSKNDTEEEPDEADTVAVRANKRK